MKKPRERQKAHVICIGNQKGGVGKTTNCVQLAAAFTQRGRKCLIIDLDMTAGATKSLKAPTQGWNDSFDLLTGPENARDAVIDNNDPDVKLPPNLHLVPGSGRLKDLEQYLHEHEWVVQQDMLLGPVEQLRSEYDYIFLDTPPQSTKTTIPALKASDFAILSAMPDRLAVEALGEAIQQILTAQHGPHPDLILLGVVVCSVPKPKTRLARALIDSLEAAGSIADGVPLKFDVEIGRTVVLQEATQVGQTVFQYAPGHEVAEQYLELADEVERRIKVLTAEDYEPVESDEEEAANG